MIINGHEIHCVTFDLDDTLWECFPVIIRAEEAFFHWLGNHYPEIARHFTLDTLIAHRREVFGRYPDMEHDFSWLRKRWFAGLIEEYQQDPGLVDAGFDVFLKARNTVDVFDGVTDLLSRINQHYRCGSITNGNADIRLVGLEQYFDFEITAIKAGAAKPSAIIFDAAIAAAGVAPEHILHIGDDMERDVRGAGKMGMQTVWINPQQQPWEGEHPPAMVFDKVTDLARCLQQALAV